MVRNKDGVPLLSIVIASRNRFKYAISAIQSILSIPDDRLELVLQDNSDTRDLESYVFEHVNDMRFRYRYTPPPFSSIDNFNAALELATGEYLCLIGDDDGINPEILDAASWAKSLDLDSLVGKHKVNYLWPNTGVQSSFFTKVTGGSLSISSICGTISNANMETELKKLMRNGGSYFMYFNLPKLYHGLVHRRCLEAIHDKTGTYLGGLSPDIFASLSVACVAKRVVVIDYPLTVPGACGASSSVTEGAVKCHSNRLEDAPHFRDRGEYHWCEIVPRIYTTQTIWADSGVAALNAMGRHDLVKRLSLPKLAANCIKANRGVTYYVLREMYTGLRRTGKSPIIGGIRCLICLLTCSAQNLLKRSWNRLLMIVGIKPIQRIDGLENIVAASHALSHHLACNGHSFLNYVNRQKTVLR